MRPVAMVQQLKRVTVKATSCGLGSHSRKLKIKYFYFFQAWTGLVECSIPTRGNEYLSKFVLSFLRFWCGCKGRRWVPSLNRQCLQIRWKWGIEDHNTRFSLSTLQCAGYSVKLIKIYTKFNDLLLHLIIT